MQSAAETKSHLKYWLAMCLPVFILDHFLKNSVSSIINPGISFGIGHSLSNNLWLGVYLVLIIAAIYWLARGQLNGKVLLTLILLSSSNIVDRLIFDGIRDYLNVFDLYLNLTDIAINLFIIWFIFVSIRAK